MRKRADIRNFYVNDMFVPTWDEFIKICRREGESASEKIRDFVTRYVEVHGHGNPQMLLSSFAEKQGVGWCKWVERKRGNQFYCGLKKYWMLRSECEKCEKRK